MSHDPSAVEVARRFHEHYERLAPSYAYETRPDSAVPWEAVPEPNRSLMIAVADEVLWGLEQDRAAAGLAVVRVGEVPPWMAGMVEAAREAVASECDVAYPNTTSPICLSCYEDMPCSKTDLRAALNAIDSGGHR
jgi:hypothetical protein